MEEGTKEQQVARPAVLTVTKQKFIRGLEKFYPDEVFDYTLNDDSTFKDPKTQQLWRFYCQAKEDQAWYSPAGHVIARVCEDGIQIAKEAKVIRHTAQINKIIGALRRKHGGEYITLSIIGADIGRLRNRLQVPQGTELNEFQVKVVDHTKSANKTLFIEPKKENGVDGTSATPHRR